MKKRIAVWVVLLAVFAPAGLTRSAPPEIISYQGLLTDDQGVVVQPGMYDLRFSIYDTAAMGTGTPLFSQLLQVDVVDGLYNVLLSSNELPSGASLGEVFQNGMTYMEIVIENGPGLTGLPITLSPRQQIASVPYALVATDPPPPALPDPLPIGGIILWADPTGDEDCDQNTTPGECPCGFTRDSSFDQLTIRGADAVGSPSDIPEEVGTVCDDEWGGGVAGACDASADKYDDVLGVSELAAHTHGLTDVSGGDAGPGTWLQRAQQSTGDVPKPTDSTGGGGAHYHPFRAVLFCRKD